MGVCGLLKAVALQLLFQNCIRGEWPEYLIFFISPCSPSLSHQLPICSSIERFRTQTPHLWTCKARFSFMSQRTKSNFPTVRAGIYTALVTPIHILRYVTTFVCSNNQFLLLANNFWIHRARNKSFCLKMKLFVLLQVEWSPPVHSQDLVKILSNGTLVFHPFAVEKYRHEIHASVYRYDIARPFPTWMSSCFLSEMFYYSWTYAGLMFYRAIFF